MTAIFIVAGLFALAGITLVVLPFFTGRGGFLAAAGTINDPVRLEAMRRAIVARIVREEASHARGELSDTEWSRRLEYLRHRYIDVARRLDFLKRSAGGGVAIVAAMTLAFSGLAGETARAASAAKKEPLRIGDRHAIMLRGGVDQVWGHYVFTLQNDGKAPAEIMTPVMLPAGAVDVTPQEGISPEEVVVGADGKVALRKTVPPGTHLLSFGFVVPAKTGVAPVEFVAPYAIPEMQVLTQRSGSLVVSGDRLSVSRPGIWSLDVGPGGLAEGEKMLFQVAGVPEGRQRLWILGLSAAALLTGLGGGLALWSRPKTKEDSRDEDDVGA